MAQRRTCLKWFNAEQYGVVQETGQIDFDQLRDQAKARQPKIILAGGSAYPRELNLLLSQIAMKLAHLMVDMAHISGLSPQAYIQILSRTRILLHRLRTRRFVQVVAVSSVE